MSLTTAKLRNLLVSEYRSNEDLLDCLVCSCFIPGFSGYSAPTFRGERFLDGGLTNNQPILDDQTIRVNALASDNDIRPIDGGKLQLKLPTIGSDRVHLSAKNVVRLKHAFSPPSDIDRLYPEGYRDTAEYLETRFCDR